MHHQTRGQIIPIWIFAIFIGVVFIGVLIDYGTILSWQIRAQRAADAAASLEVSVQAQEWNRMILILFIGNVEEYRLRVLLNGALLAAHSQGPCFGTASPSTGAAPNACFDYYNRLLAAYTKSVWRYSQIVQLLQSSIANESLVNQRVDAENLVGELSSPGLCDTPHGLDCAFAYLNKESDGGKFDTFNYSGWRSDFTGARCMTGPGSPFPQCPFYEENGPENGSMVPGTFAQDENQAFLAPAEADVTVCHKLNLPLNFLETFVQPPNSFQIIAHSSYKTFPSVADGIGDNQGPSPSYIENFTQMPGGHYDWYDPNFTLTEDDFSSWNKLLASNYWEQMTWFGAYPTKSSYTPPTTPASCSSSI